MDTPTAVMVKTGRELVDHKVFERVANRVISEQAVSWDEAARIVDQALVFLAGCAENPGRALTPSLLVDWGWHAFILHTSDYMEFCERIAGGYIHHCPLDGDGEGGMGSEDTMKLLQEQGLPVDEKLWLGGGDAKCSEQCCKGKGAPCHML